ncbi:hypothetical protein J2X34_003193 [Rhodococcus sp. BE178]
MRAQRVKGPSNSLGAFIGAVCGSRIGIGTREVASLGAA